MKLYQLTGHELRDLLHRKEVSVLEVTESFLKRIETVEPQIGALLDIQWEQARGQAEQRDSQGQEPGVWGIPYVLKDNICTKGIATTCASKMLEGYKPPYNAQVTDQLSSGILLGKANMDEFAMGSSTESSYFKQTQNPYDLERIPGGSSGGSAACVAAGEAVFSLGSDTGGSIRQPAAFCGIVGLKPTYGLVSRYGLVAFASSMEQIGPMTKDVTDCAMVLSAIAGHDQRDATSISAPSCEYEGELGKGIRGLRIGIVQEYMGQEIASNVKNAVSRAAQTLETLGARCEICSLPRTKYVLPVYYILSSAEASSNLARFDGVRLGYRSTKGETIEELIINSRSEGFGPEVKRRILLGTFVLSHGYYEEYYGKAQRMRAQICREYTKAFQTYDLLLTPSAPDTAWKKGELQPGSIEVYSSDLCSVAANITGLPAISVPCGFDNGLPIGMQLMARPFEEAKLLRTAFAFEQAGTVAKPPMQV